MKGLWPVFFLSFLIAQYGVAQDEQCSEDSIVSACYITGHYESIDHFIIPKKLGTDLYSKERLTSLSKRLSKDLAIMKSAPLSKMDAGEKRSFLLQSLNQIDQYQDIYRHVTALIKNGDIHFSEKDEKIIISRIKNGKNKLKIYEMKYLAKLVSSIPDTAIPPRSIPLKAMDADDGDRSLPPKVLPIEEKAFPPKKLPMDDGVDRSSNPK